MELQKFQNDSVLTIKPIGNLDSTTASELEPIKNQLDDCTELIIDLQEVGYISSKGIRIILMLNKEMQGHLKLSNANKAVLEVFKLSGLLNVLSFE